MAVARAVCQEKKGYSDREVLEEMKCMVCYVGYMATRMERGSVTIRGVQYSWVWELRDGLS